MIIKYNDKGAISMKRFSVSLFILAAFPCVASADETWDMYHMMYWIPWGGMFIMPVLMVCLVILLIYFFRKPRTDTFYQSYKQESAMDILKRRYASGEITREEFEDMKKNIS